MLKKILPKQSSVFRINRSQAVRIPKGLAFPDTVKKVEIIPVEGGLLLKAIGAGTWAEFFSRPGLASDDFMTTRDQGVFEERPSFDPASEAEPSEARTEQTSNQTRKRF